VRFLPVPNTKRWDRLSHRDVLRYIIFSSMTLHLILNVSWADVLDEMLPSILCFGLNFSCVSGL
jgi:hypothetical protein